MAKSLVSLTLLVWLNVWFWLLVPVVTVIFLIVGIPYVILFLLIVRNRRRAKWLLRRTISHYGLTVIKCGWPLVRVRYVDYAPEAKPPFVIVANHRSASDAFLIGCLPLQLVQVLNNWPSKIPAIGQIALLAGYLKVRSMPFDDFLQAGTKRLEEGASVVAFPEGTRSGSRNMGPFHSSAFRLAQHVGVDVVPLAISGNENIPRRGSMLLHPGRIVVAKLPAVTKEHYKDMSAFTLKTLVRERIRQHLEAQVA